MLPVPAFAGGIQARTTERDPACSTTRLIGGPGGVGLFVPMRKDVGSDRKLRRPVVSMWAARKRYSLPTSVTSSGTTTSMRSVMVSDSQCG